MKATITILDVEWQVKLVEYLGDELGSDNNGTCNFSKKTICINKDLSVEYQEKTLFHEITHAIITQLLMNKETFTQEEVCKFVENYGKFIVKESEERE
jgi:Zn-dependent peptidase ImmA (M78 family)